MSRLIFTPNFFNQKGGMKIVLTNLQGILLINWTITKKKRLTKTLTLDMKFSKVIKILKPNKSPGEDGIISEFYQLFWQDIKTEFFEVVEQIFKFEYTLSASQYKGVLTLLHKGGEREDIKKKLETIDLTEL